MMSAPVHSPAHRKISHRYFPAVDALRAFAALSVVVYHTIHHYRWESFPETGPLSWFRRGWMGVDLFFVISGFVIAYSAISLYRSQPGNFSRIYLWRRLTRIVPLHYLTLAVYIVIVVPELFNMSANYVLTLIGTHLLFIFGWFTSTHGTLNPPNWSVAVEMQFYIAMLLATPFLARMRIRTIVAICVPVAWAYRLLVRNWLVNQGFDDRALFVYTTQLPGTLDEFCAGIVLAKIVLGDAMISDRIKEHLRRWSLPWAILISLAVYGLFLWIVKGRFYEPENIILLRSLLAIGGIALVTSAVYFRPGASLKMPGLFRMPWRAILYLGQISYGIYMWQAIVIRTIRTTPLVEHPFWALLLTLAIVIALAALSWHFFERFFIRWGARKADKLVEMTSVPAMNQINVMADNSRP